MTEKEKLFCKEYIVDRNATQAAIRAGYSKKTASAIGHENLSKPKIKKVIDKEIEARNKRVNITQEEIISDIKEVRDRCLQREEVLDNKGNPTGEWVFKENGVLKACELLGKHLKMFTDRVETTGTQEFIIVTPEEKAMLEKKK